MVDCYSRLYRTVFVFLFVCIVGTVSSQVVNVNSVLDSLAKKEIPELNKKVSISISQMKVGEFIRAIANDAGLNISIPKGLDNYVSNNFKNVAAKDILVYLCKDNNLNLEVTGNIIKISKKPAPPVKEKDIKISYNKLRGEFTMDLNDDPLGRVVKKISEVSGRNVILSPGLMKQNVNGFVRSSNLKEALNLLAHSNNLKVKTEGRGVYIIEKKFSKDFSKFRNNKSVKSFVPALRNVSIDPKQGITVNVVNEPLDRLFKYVADKANLRYHMLSKLDAKVNLSVNNLSIEKFLYNLFKGSKYSYKIQDGVCYVGDRKMKELKDCRMVKFNYRSVSKLSELLPKSYIAGLDVKEFEELNSLFVCGDTDRIIEFMELMHEIDQKVPVVLIDVIIVEVTDNVDLSVGVQAALGTESTKTEGGLAPGSEKGVSVSMNGNTINNVFNNLGFARLGRVNPNFYLKLKALDESGKANIRSTPRLSTINGHEAKLKIGKKEYYKEETNNYWGSQNPQLAIQKVYKPVEANLEVKIKPMISGDGSVNMEISVEQSDFTSRIIDDAPPGMVTRKFESMIRVMDRETILLGGLEQNTDSKSSKGVPVLSKIPVLKWFFGSNSKSKHKSRLNILIRPAIIN
jgi:type IV pilus assembly protein PilQ